VNGCLLLSTILHDDGRLETFYHVVEIPQSRLDINLCVNTRSFQTISHVTAIQKKLLNNMILGTAEMSAPSSTRGLHSSMNHLLNNDIRNETIIDSGCK